MAVDQKLVDRLQLEVGDEVTEKITQIQASGRDVASEDERQIAQALIQDKIRRLAERSLERGLHPMTREEEVELSSEVFNRIYGLGRIQALIDDPRISNIHINGCDNVHVVYSDGTKTKVPAVAPNDRALVDMISSAARRVGRSERRWDDANPSVDVQLPDGSRLNAVQGITDRPMISIRCHDFGLNQVKHLEEVEMFDSLMGDFLRAVVEARLTLVVAGATNAGKTTLLRCLLNEITPTERIITIEDNLELGLDRFPERHPDLVTYETRSANTEGRGAIDMSYCLRASLRQNPNRVVVGEVRGKEVVEMVRAMSQGNEGSMCSIHADSSSHAIERMILYMSEAGVEEETAFRWIPSAVDLIIHVGYTTDREPKRTITSVREVLSGEGDLVATNEVWVPGPNNSAVPAPAAGVSSSLSEKLRRVGFDMARTGVL
ncbi:MAG: CpaF family protein [Acidimicrobiia bacterium]|nr:CpaF family protein [Acidimicrobiia bacterium]